MTDYYAVLKKAISGLEHESGDVRRSVYDKARTALIGQLKAIQPPLTTSEISRQRLELEEAIRRVEREAAVTAAGPVPARARAAAAVADALAVDPSILDEEPEAEIEPEAEQPPEPEYEAVPEYEEEAEVVEPPPPPPRVPARPTPPPQRQAPPTRVLPDATVPIHIDAVDQPYEEPAFEVEPDDPSVVKPAWPQAPAAQQSGGATARRGGTRQEPRLEPAPAQRSAPPPWVPRVDPADAAPRGRPQQQPQQRREPPPFVPQQDEPRFDPADDAPTIETGGEWQDPFEEAPTLDQEFAEEARERGDRGRKGGKRRRERDEEARYFGEKPRPSRWPALILLIIIGLILGGVAALAWSQRAFVKDVIGDLISSADKPASSPAPAADTDNAASNKNADRLGGAASEEAPRAVRTVDAAPPDDDAMSAARDAATQSSESAAGAEGEPLPGLPAETSAATGGDTTNSTQQALVAQKAILYEQPTGGGASVTALNGNVVWSFDANSSNGPEIQAHIDIPDRQMKVTVNIRRNTDSSLPASHLVEVIIDTPPDFPGGGIKQVPAFVMKPTEEARGQPLDGAPAKVADGFFWIAFSNEAGSLTQNIALMRERNWIDIPLIYDNDQRAILTLEKGAPGQKAFEQALAAWGN